MTRDHTLTHTTIALAADMIFASKMRGAAQAAGITLTLARNAAQLVELAAQTPTPSLIVLDLDTRGLPIAGTIAALRDAAPDVPILAYVSHVRADAIAEARAAGAHRVLARSAFVSGLPGVLSAK